MSGVLSTQFAANWILELGASTLTQGAYTASGKATAAFAFYFSNNTAYGSITGLQNAAPTGVSTRVRRGPPILPSMYVRVRLVTPANNGGTVDLTGVVLDTWVDINLTDTAQIRLSSAVAPSSLSTAAYDVDFSVDGVHNIVTLRANLQASSG